MTKSYALMSVDVSNVPRICEVALLSSVVTKRQCARLLIYFHRQWSLFDAAVCKTRRCKKE